MARSILANFNLNATIAQCIAFFRRRFARHSLRRFFDERDTAAVISRGDAVLGDDQIALKRFGHLAQHMFQRSGIEFILHLRQFRILRRGQLPLRPVERAGIILHAQKIVAFDVRQIVGEFFFPRRGGKRLALRCALSDKDLRLWIHESIVAVRETANYTGAATNLPIQKLRRIDESGFSSIQLRYKTLESFPYCIPDNGWFW